ncbi:MAG: DNA-directed RNA polymerase subunit beta [Clostridia bacterium]|nr:DNA-directed RNA polymerase subunit beta [Clostridia bacterium]
MAKAAKKVRQGEIERLSYGSKKEVMGMPNFLEIQKESYNWFLKKGLREVFRDIDKITDYTGKLELSLLDYKLDDTPKYSISECKKRETTYSSRMTVTARLRNKETGEVKEQEVYMGDFPIMTENGTFVINGAERVIVSQLVRSPGVYFKVDYDKVGTKLYSTQIIPNRGAWLEFETDQNGIYFVRIDKTKKIFVTTFIRALFCGTDLGRGTDDDILDMFGDDDRINVTLDKEKNEKGSAKAGGPTNAEEAILEVYRKLRPGEPPMIDTAQTYIDNLFFDARRYDLSRVGRYKYNKKLAISDRIAGCRAADMIVSEATGEILAEPGEYITKEKAYEIEQAGVSKAYVDVDGKRICIISNGMVDIGTYFPQFTKEQLEDAAINEKVSFKALKSIVDAAAEEGWSDEDILKKLEENCDALIPKHIVRDDIFAAINYLNCLANGLGSKDDIDHLGSRRIRCVGELLQNQFRIGFSRMERVIRERMSMQGQDDEKATPQTLISIRPVTAAIKEFFGSSQLSQFMDQTNPLSELTHKRRLSALGPGGLNRERAGFEVRDVHYSHYGRMCPIETPEGPNIGLISHLATFARINEYGFVEAPYRKVDKETGIVSDEVVYMTADVEDNYIVAQANEPLDENNRFKNPRVNARYRDEFLDIENSKVDFMDVSPKMVVSVATAMIPFLENDDANRALMGANMQKQAVPLLKAESPIVATGMEYKAAVDSGASVVATNAGTVTYVSAERIEILNDNGVVDVYDLVKFQRSNQGTCINQRPVVDAGQRVEAMQVIADGPATDHGEISLGKNALIGFMTWEGYNYEDAVLINEKLVRDDVYTSIHIEKYEIEARETKQGPEDITRDIPNVGDDVLKDLDADGIIRIGAEVRSGDILVGKVTPKGETELTNEERLLRAIFGEKAREVRDTSLRVPHGEYGIVVDVEVFTRENSDELNPGVNKVIRCYIAQKRKLSVGDKMAGRHGNKGVVSRILPQEDMPFLPDGTPLDIVLNPLGVPSRMNIGQVLEVHLGFAAKSMGVKVMTPVFDGADENDIIETFKMANAKLMDDARAKALERGEEFNEEEVFQLRSDCKSILRDGRTGKQFDNPVTVGIMYYLKLLHLVDDKIHARSTGPYSLITQQPLGGKAQFGGQRFGEMEVWALEAYGAAYTLQEILTVKSDDVVGRVKTYQAITKGLNIPKPGVPESFKVLIKELQSLGLDIKVLDADQNEIDLRQTLDDDNVTHSIDSEAFSIVNDAEGARGFTSKSGEELDQDDDCDSGSDAYADDVSDSDE